MSRTTQRDRLRLLFEANLSVPIPLPKILELGIAQYGARILELRREGYDIRNDTVDVVDGQKHTAFTYHGRRTVTVAPRDDWHEPAHGPRPFALAAGQAGDRPLFDSAEVR